MYHKNGFYFNGVVSSVKVFNKALTARQIKAEYEATRLNYMKWWERLYYWLRVTIYILIGKEVLR